MKSEPNLLIEFTWKITHPRASSNVIAKVQKEVFSSMKPSLQNKHIIISIHFY
jgi:hypothetical protein